MPELWAQWYHEFLDDSRGVATSLPGAPALGTFSPQRDFALVGVGLNTAFTGYHGMPVGLFINYNCPVGQSDYIANSVNGWHPRRFLNHLPAKMRRALPATERPFFASFARRERIGVVRRA